MNPLKNTLRAATLALLTSQASCSSVPAVSPKLPEEPQTKDMVDLVKDHWVQNYRVNFKRDFDAAKTSCSVEKRKLTLSMSCYVPSKHRLHRKDGLYFNVDRSNFTRQDGTLYSRVSIQEKGTKKFEYVKQIVDFVHLEMRSVNFTVPGLCKELVGTPNFQAQECSDQVSVYLTNQEFIFTPVTSTDHLEILSQANRLRPFLDAAESAQNELERRFGIDDWFDRQVEKAKEERRDALELLVKKFRATVKATKSYQSLIGNAQFEPLFEQYLFLSNPVMGVARLKSTLEDPERLDHALLQIKFAELPRFDQLALQRISVYIAQSLEEVQQVCHSKNSGACYDINTQTIILPPEAFDIARTLTHELAHHYMGQLSPGERFRIKRKLQPMLMKREVQKDVIRFKEQNLADSWQDGTYGPRFNCPRPYAASNFDEYVAVYKEDLFNNHGMNIVSLLGPGNKKYHNDVITTLETLAESGLFGDIAREVLDDLYQKVVIRYGKQ